ncbi:MAG: gluconolactonase [Lachnospiraceae bacterium]|nr:gluconolactonase [Lachnospiraceae bacterium]
MKLKIYAKRLVSALLTAVVLATGVGSVAEASSLPYSSYNYTYWEDIVFTPAAYVPRSSVSGTRLEFGGESIGAFVNPQDLCKSPSGDIFVADTGNNRIVVLNSDMTQVINIVTSFDNNGMEDTFNAPYGVAVSDSNQLYIADSQNRRIVVLNKDGSLARIIENPTSEALEDGFVFTPLKVAVDYADRVYCIAQKMYEGIMVFETNNEFAGFFGTISVDITLWEKFWRKIATKEERSKSQLFIPTEFTGIDIDPSGFVYASNIDSNAIQGVRRLNPKGEDVIKKGANENLGGDLQYEGNTDYSGPSQFTDVVYRNNGIYSCLDRKRGRIFTYDHEGNLLYIFGGMGTQAGTFSMPVAIEDVGGYIVVLDAARAEISYFEPTEYGKLINEAVSLRYDGDEAQAVEIWKQVLILDENNELANTGIGKAYLTAGDYEEAMKYLELGRARDYYSVAFKRFRNDVLTANANVFLTGAAIVIAAFVVYKQVKKRRKGERRNG